MATSPELFALIARNEEALAVVDLNPTYATSSGGQHYLLFRTDRLSKKAGQLASFGRHETNDIRLPSGPSPPGRGSRSRDSNTSRGYQNYRNNHFFFFLAPSGELILRDLTPCLTTLEVRDASPEEAMLYALHGSNPRQRVIPRTPREIFITFGTRTSFLLMWNPLLMNESVAQQDLAQQARLLAATGMSLSKPDEEDPKPPRIYELRSRYTPSVVTQSRPYKYCHKYAVLGAGTFGVVSKVVDLSSGELWAVKEIKAGAKDDRWKSAFKTEVEMIAPLRHPNIAHFENFQDFCIGGNFQLFFRLYRGSLRRLLPPHACVGRLPDIAQWMPRLLDQVLGALDYLHQQGVIHRDIKPDNVLFDFDKGDAQPNFYVADFGLSVNTDAVSGSTPAGTLAYMAPEIVLDGKTYPVSDVWSLAIMLGRVLGYWCETERSMTASAWADKLASLGGELPYTEPAQFSQPLSSQRRWYHRIVSLVEGGFLPSMFTHMLAVAPHRASPADCREATVDEFTRRPDRPRALFPDPKEDAVWHLSARSMNEMSIDVPRGLY